MLGSHTHTYILPHTYIHSFPHKFTLLHMQTSTHTHILSDMRNETCLLLMNPFVCEPVFKMKKLMLRLTVLWQSVVTLKCELINRTGSHQVASCIWDERLEIYCPRCSSSGMSGYSFSLHWYTVNIRYHFSVLLPYAV